MSDDARRPVNRGRAILRNVASNWIAYAINALVTLALTPFVLHRLGPAQYGVWVLTTSVIGYYGMLDLGFRGGVTQFLTRYLAVKDYPKASGCLSSAVSALSVVALAIVPLSLLMAWLAPHLFTLPPDVESDAFWCILIVGCTSAFQFAFFPFSAIFTAKQRFDLANLIGIGTRLLTAGSIFAALKLGYGLVGVSAATCGASVVDYLIRWQVARRLVPELEVSWRHAKRERLKEIASFGGWNFQISISQYAEVHAQTLIIGLILPIAAAGHYALATGLIIQITAVLGPIGQVMYPAAAELHARGEHENVKRLFRDGTRLVMLAAVTVVLGGGFWATDFYRLWIGEQYLTGTPFPSVSTLFHILLIAMIPAYASNIAGQLMLATGNVRSLSMCLLTGSAVNVALMLLLGNRMGLTGIAIATVTASLLTNLVLIPTALQKHVEFPVRKVLHGALWRPFAVGAVLCVVFTGIQLLGHAHNWAELGAQGLLAGIAAVVTILIVGLTPQERDQFLWQPAGKFFRRDADSTA
jgi:O-antigen/teichoic acid export membrane protein